MRTVSIGHELLSPQAQLDEEEEDKESYGPEIEYHEEEGHPKEAQIKQLRDRTEKIQKKLTAPNIFKAWAEEAHSDTNRKLRRVGRKAEIEQKYRRIYDQEDTAFEEAYDEARKNNDKVLMDQIKKARLDSE